MMEANKPMEPQPRAADRGRAKGPAPFVPFSVKTVWRGEGPRMLPYIATLTGRVMVEPGSGRRIFPRERVLVDSVEMMVPNWATAKFEDPAHLWSRIEEEEAKPNFAIALDVYAKMHGPTTAEDLGEAARDFAMRTWVGSGAGVLAIVGARDPAKPGLAAAVRFVVTIRKLGSPQLGRPNHAWRDGETHLLWRLDWLESCRQHARSVAADAAHDASTRENAAIMVRRLEAESARLMSEVGVGEEA